MKRVFYLFLLFCPFLILGQSDVSQLANEVNAENRPSKKALLLEKALNSPELLIDSVFTEFRNYLDYSSLNSRMLLTLNSHEARSGLFTGTYNRDISQPLNEPNPYIKYFDANYVFYQGDALMAREQFKSCLDKFSALNDSFYLSSALNNIGAIYWSLDAPDSALHYFLQAKKYTYWYNDMLESNILAIANELNDEALSIRQIEIIQKNNPSSRNGVYLNNLYHYYQNTQPERLDSIASYIYNVFDSISEVPEELIPVYVKECWDTDLIAARIVEMPKNAYFANSLSALVKNACVLDSAYSDSVLIKLNSKIEVSFIKDCIESYLIAGFENRPVILDLIQNIVLGNEDESTQITRLQDLIESYEREIDESEAFIKKSGVITIVLAFLALITIIFLQRRKIKETQKVNTLVRNNSELEKERIKISGELTAVRKSINNIARENLEKLNELRSLIANQEGFESDTDQSFRDLNIIRTHQEGITRFKINRFCDDLNDEPMKKFEPLLSEQEFKIFKLMILEFRSKEIAILLDVSHQYINNKRHKIRTSLAEAGFDLDELVTTLRKELYA
ncbi:MAG: hypothetical protein PVJ94_00790 [Flavobacteriales bacterium]|jgi:hypothetical protein